MDVLKKISRNGHLILFMSFFVFNSAVAASTTNFQQSKSIWEKSYALEQQKKYAEASNVINPILSQSPHNELALLRQGWLNYLQAKYNVSEGFYHKALDANSDSFDAKLGLTLPLLAQQRWKEAATYANQVISASAWNYYAHIRLMTSESGLAQWEALEKHASEFIKHYPSDVSGFLFLAQSQAMQGKKDLATQNYQEVLLRSPTNVEAMKFLGRKK